jgi:hypothetical protein
MRNLKIIRILIGMNLIIFLLPFFNTCSNEPLKEENKEILHDIKSNKSISQEYKEELIQDELERYIDIKKSHDDDVLSGYELSVLPFRNMNVKMFNEPFVYFSFCFTLLLISVFFMVFLALKQKFKVLKTTVIFAFILAVISLLIPLFGGILGYLDQVKLGYYLFLIDLSLIFFLLNKLKINERAITKSKLYKGLRAKTTFCAEIGER